MDTALDPVWRKVSIEDCWRGAMLQGELRHEPSGRTAPAVQLIKIPPAVRLDRPQETP